MIGFYHSFMVITFGVLVSAANFSLFGITIDIPLPERPCGNHSRDVRKEWCVFSDSLRTNRELTSHRGELKRAERIDYTNAVLCMQGKPQHLPREEYPGVRNRFDDFVA